MFGQIYQGSRYQFCGRVRLRHSCELPSKFGSSPAPSGQHPRPWLRIEGAMETPFDRRAGGALQSAKYLDQAASTYSRADRTWAKGPKMSPDGAARARQMAPALP